MKYNYWGKNKTKPIVYGGLVGEPAVDTGLSIQKLTRLRVWHEKSLKVAVPIRLKKEALGFKTRRINNKKICGGCIA